MEWDMERHGARRTAFLSYCTAPRPPCFVLAFLFARLVRKTFTPRLAICEKRSSLRPLALSHCMSSFIAAAASAKPSESACFAVACGR